jgi:hypothetical protein
MAKWIKMFTIISLKICHIAGLLIMVTISFWFQIMKIAAPCFTRQLNRKVLFSPLPVYRRGLKVYPPSVCLSVRPSVRPSVCLSVCPSVRPSVCLSVRPSVRLSVCLSVCQSVSPSVHKTGSRDNLKSTENIFMKLDIWIDGSMEIMHIFFFSSYVENSGFCGNK